MSLSKAYGKETKPVIKTANAQAQYTIGYESRFLVLRCLTTDNRDIILEGIQYATNEVFSLVAPKEMHKRNVQSSYLATP